jgi:hypothetical protein
MTDHVTPAGPRGPQDKKKTFISLFSAKNIFFAYTDRSDGRQKAMLRIMVKPNSSVADMGCLSQFLTFFSIPNSGSRIPDPKKRGRGKSCLTFLQP